MSIDFHRLMEPIDINRLIFIDYIDYIDWFPMIDFHRLDRPGTYVFAVNSLLTYEIGYELSIEIFSLISIKLNEMLVDSCVAFYPPYCAF